MWEYTHYDELMHYGVKGMRWGVRRYQNADGSLTDAGKRRLATQEYRNDLKSAIGEAKNKNNKYATTYMSARLHRGQAYVKNILGGGVAGSTIAGGVKAFKAITDGADKKTVGKKFVEGCIAGGIGGVTVGTLRARKHITKGEIFSESNYDVKPMYERLNKLGVKPKGSKAYEETVRKSEADRYKLRAENEEYAFKGTLDYMKRLKNSGPTGDMMKNMYGDEAVNKKTATKLWKDELDDANHQANIQKDRIDAYKKASESLSSMDITNASARDISRLGESVVNRSFNETSGRRDKNYYKDL